jgi:hypothetical protein
VSTNGDGRAGLAEELRRRRMALGWTLEQVAEQAQDGMATRRRIEEVRGAAQLSIGPDGPVSLPRDSSETLALCSPEACSVPTGTIMRWDGRWSTGRHRDCSSCSV